MQKTLTDDPLATERSFRFTLTPDPQNPEGAALAADGGETVINGLAGGEGTAEFAPITFTRAGTYRFTISEVNDDQQGILYDTDPWTLTITVEDVDGQLTIDPTGGAVYTRAAEGGEQISTGSAAFRNTYKGTGDLKVTKAVSGSRGSTTKDFTFTVTLTAADGSPVNGTFPAEGGSLYTAVAAPAVTEVTFTEGRAEFTLRHGQTLTIQGLPDKAAYTVTESDNAGYSVTASGQAGEISNDHTAEAGFRNYRGGGGGRDDDDDDPPPPKKPPEIPETGMNWVLPALLALAGGALLALGLRPGKKKTGEDHEK